MNILAVDNEQSALNLLTKAIKKAVPDCNLAAFTTAQSALEHSMKVNPDVAFLDISMPGMSGLMLAKRLKEIYGRTNIVFVTGYSQYTTDALGMYVSGYLMKPAASEDITRELENLRHPVEWPEKVVCIQCFGNFEIFVDGKPVEFRRKKSKQLLAYLVDRHGAMVSNKELAAILWEDIPYSQSIQSQLQTLISEMMRALSAVGAEHIIIKQYGSIGIDVQKVVCDAYLYKLKDPRGVNAFYGQYMAGYSWGEFSLGAMYGDN